MRTPLRPLLLSCCLAPLLAHAQPDCQPIFALGGTTGHYIDGLLLGSINYANSNAAAIPGYENWCYYNADFHTVLVAGETVNAVITSGPDGQYDQYAIWVDLDHDLHYSDQELVSYGVATGAGVNLTPISVAIPAGAKRGYTAMRVLCAANQVPLDPCGAYTAGEAQDYTVIIDDGTCCMPQFYAQANSGDYVAAVQLNDLAWTVSSDPPLWGYEDATVYGAHLQSEGTYTMTVTKGYYVGANNVYVWIDWYNNGLDANSLVGTQTATGAGSTVTFSITAPAEFAGYARMRVACTDEPISNNDPCGSTQFGHAVDLTLAVGHVGWPCLPLLGYGTTYGDGIDSLTLFGATYAGATHYPYVEGTDDRFRYDAGYSGNMQVVAGAYEHENYGLWLDMNDNSSFEYPDELLGSVQNSVPHEQLNLPYTVPANCPPGQHFMRLRSNDANSPIADGCADAFYGSTFTLVVVVEAPQGPCVPSLYDWTIYGTFIDGVVLGTLTNTSTGAAWGPAYTQYALSTDLVIATPQTLTITNGAHAGDSFGAWIDYNADNDFDDANEALGTVTIADVYADGSIPFTVPNGTTLGAKHLRVRNMPLATMDPCADADYGETEDYTVVITQNTGLATSDNSTLQLLSTEDGLRLLGGAADIGTAYTLFDATGRTLMQGRIASTSTELPLLGQAHGAYMVQLSTSTARHTLRMVW